MPEFHKPVRRPAEFLETLVASGDPSESLAHDSAAALLHRVRAAEDPALAQRIVDYANVHGIDDVAELWADARPDTLPGAMWRIHLLRHVVASDPDKAGWLYRLGLESASPADEVVAGAPHRPTPQEVLRLANDILRGVFAGDFAVALDRACEFSRIQAAGCTASDDAPAAEAYARFATDLAHAATLWRASKLS